MNKGEPYIGFWVNTLTNIPMCAVLSIVSPIVLGQFLNVPNMLTPISWLQGFILSYFVGFCVGSFLPLVPVSQKLAALLHANNAVAYIIRCLVGGVLMTVFIDFFMVFINSIVSAGFAVVWASFLTILPPTLLAACIVQLVVNKACTVLGMKIALRS